MSEKQLLLEVLKPANQDHILDDYDTLTDQERATLFKQIIGYGFDFVHLNNIFQKSVKLLRNGVTAVDESDSLRIEPPIPSSIFYTKEMARTNPEKIDHLNRVGMKAIHEGKAAVLLLAGGSGTRLGISVPKGMFTCDTLPQKKSLFQVHSEKILRIQHLTESCINSGAGEARQSYSGRDNRPRSTCVIQFVIMTSEQNDSATRSFFEENNFFGLQREQVHFFEQNSLPCYDEATGKVLMESKSSICLSPGGNGSIYQSLARPIPCGDKKVSTLDKLKHIGVTHVQIFNVDNILAKIADPLFYGYAIQEESHVVAKTAMKAHADERVGVFARMNGQWGVVEYTEIGQERAHAVDSSTGTLLYNCANISCQLCSIPFLEFVAEKMKSFTLYHAACKNINTKNGPVMGIKIESFIFDLFRFCNDPALNKNRCPHNSPQGSNNNHIQSDNFSIMMVEREEEFAPIKNAFGAVSDTPCTAANLLLSLHSKWARNALQVYADAHKNNLTDESNKRVQLALKYLDEKKRFVEISPLVSYDGEHLHRYIPFMIDQILKEDSSDRIVSVTGSEADKKANDAHI